MMTREMYGWVKRTRDVVDAADALCGRMSAALYADLLDGETARDLRALMAALAHLRCCVDGSEVPA